MAGNSRITALRQPGKHYEPSSTLLREGIQDVQGRTGKNHLGYTGHAQAGAERTGKRYGIR